MTIAPDERANGPVGTQERFPPEPVGYVPPAAGYRTDGRDALVGRDGLPGRDGHQGERMGHAGEFEPESDLPAPGRASSGGLDLSGLTEPVFPPAGWLDSPGGSLADHPLLRGLLLELPPKGSVPPPGWLDRWFEAARSILELLYLQQGGGRPR
ncbi:hypothetical protein [Phytohabitans kaempferiae]|uniref:Uncharacterized protein n=1 Tax=Phytohabitans kaempferiae TaxID=1620943 RepID=A0ABV6MDP8_9ACTN